MRYLFVVSSLFLATATFAADLQVGQIAATAKLEGEQGAKVDGSAWSSDEMKGYVTSLFYIDPDDREKNEPLEAAFKKELLPKDKHKSVAIINMAATWLPNGIIASKLATKQKDFPDTVYVKDFKKSLVAAWGLADDAINLVVFDKDGKVLVLQKGPLPEAQFADLMKTIRAAL